MPSPPTPCKPDRPVLWIVAGPNGSGKSTFYDRIDIRGWGGSIWIINPDLLTQTVVEREGLALAEANLVSVQRIEQWLDAAIDTYQSIGVETVLSSPKFRRLTVRAQQRGFLVKMIYVTLASAELQLRRIAVRVAHGGHDVPAEKVRDRRQRSFRELAWFAQHVDQCSIFENSVGEPDLVASLAHGQLMQYGE
ncbi:AAA family ATPase [Sphingomonas sp.]|uniref:AAA family ATPase n=1 Tax=Sphingomonas sp. TaxID=28214 RepID=UPI002D7E17D9|nr:AAA family ATPase [Sphingomonas sp.]HEU0045024.1 AAA family ATPase [Sphingomonas sp.]